MRDLDETAYFYGVVLGTSVGAIIEGDARGAAGRTKRCRPGEGGSWGLHFFESPDAGLPAMGRRIDRDALMRTVGVQHIAFALPDESAGIEPRERLKENGVDPTEIGSAGPTNNTLFFDNDGLLLEAAWPKPRRRGEVRPETGG